MNQCKKSEILLQNLLFNLWKCQFCYFEVHLFVLWKTNGKLNMYSLYRLSLYNMCINFFLSMIIDYVCNTEIFHKLFCYSCLYSSQNLLSPSKLSEYYWVKSGDTDLSTNHSSALTPLTNQSLSPTCSSSGDSCQSDQRGQCHLSEDGMLTDILLFGHW